MRTKVVEAGHVMNLTLCNYRILYADVLSPWPWHGKLRSSACFPAVGCSAGRSAVLLQNMLHAIWCRFFKTL